MNWLNNIEWTWQLGLQILGVIFVLYLVIKVVIWAFSDDDDRSGWSYDKWLNYHTKDLDDAIRRGR